ncbi:hypothetical protein LTR56_010059 [Elasticomyces elasticus]|nr:hypothetical protein LTR56_010059 [Elasticomyces elasticus]KAK3664998.1 hypothetical protein LTR22_004050 [Elasticomyces elasticus]KAK4931626.1 hypothetical protein LTR49_002018 [Elasticomyces elasticus]KAK5766785.1 hypothetical protein LTS12_003138 [Elasticomyces elasticus]
MESPRSVPAKIERKSSYVSFDDSTSIASNVTSHNPALRLDGWRHEVAPNTADSLSSTIGSFHFAGPPLQDLDEIRVVILERSGDLLRLSFVVIATDSVRPYYALSYAWGPINADGSHLTAASELDGRPVRVTQHLRSAFERLAQHHGTATECAIWCDAICIDQTDVTERNHQVAMMGTIFARAQSVLIWLGDKQTDPWFFAKPVLTCVRGAHDNLSLLYTNVTDVPQQPLRVILQDPYFTRRWVIQEVVMQPRRYVLAGSRSMEFGTLHQAISRSAHSMPLCFIEPLRGQSSLLQNLLFYRDAECSDPRDRIYALLAISEDKYDLTPQYSEGYTAVCIEFAVACISRGWLLNMLMCACESRETSLPNRLPTWVPDWRGSTSAALTPLLTSTSGYTAALRTGPSQLILEARLYWLCDAANVDPGHCQHRAASIRINDWCARHGLPWSSAGPHKCVHGTSAALCYLEDGKWGLLLASSGSSTFKAASTYPPFTLQSWFGDLAWGSDPAYVSDLDNRLQLHLPDDVLGWDIGALLDQLENIGLPTPPRGHDLPHLPFEVSSPWRRITLV